MRDTERHHSDSLTKLLHNSDGYFSGGINCNQEHCETDKGPREKKVPAK